jgi:signal transduction histidine kinase
MSAENFTLTPSQFAKKERITVETLKKRRQRGFYDGKFQNVNGKYYYLERASYSRSSAGNPSSRFRRRGAHKEGLETKYPNAAFKEHNELKMLARIKHKLGPAVLDELTPEAIEVAQQNLLKKKKQRLESAINKKNYGGMLNASEYNLLLKKHRNRQNYRSSS